MKADFSSGQLEFREAPIPETVSSVWSRSVRVSGFGYGCWADLWGVIYSEDAQAATHEPRRSSCWAFARLILRRSTSLIGTLSNQSDCSCIVS
jgi:hypothetical protein